MYRSTAILSAFLFSCLSSGAQEYTTGALLDTAIVAELPHKVRLIGADYRGLPASVSLEQYCPYPGDQGKFGTCVGFAVAYYLRTILYVKGMRDAGYEADPNAHLFSPSFVYEQIKLTPGCEKGSYPSDAFHLLKYTGVSTLRTQPYSCGAPIKAEARQEAPNFRILSYHTVYDMYETDRDQKIRATKKALSEGTPCMVVFKVAKSFYKVKSPGVWFEQPTDNGPSGAHGNHAMCVIGYDDNKYGGAFRVVNSWGTGWGEKGFAWIPYKEFTKYAWYVMSAQAQKPPPKPDPNKVVVPPPDLEGSLTFRENTGKAMEAVLQNNTTWSHGTEYDSYKMKDVYTSGTRFRFFMNTNTDAYVYAFATDLSGKVNQIFPFDAKASPLLGRNSTVAFPSEDKVIRMDDNKGTDYLLILYSTKPLNVSELIYKIRTHKSSLIDGARRALGNDLIHPENITYSAGKIGFTVRGGAPGSVAPVYIEIQHR